MYGLKTCTYIYIYDKIYRKAMNVHTTFSIFAFWSLEVWCGQEGAPGGFENTRQTLRSWTNMF